MTDLREAIAGVRHDGRRRDVRCPAHDDGRASLSVGLGADGRVLLHCHAGCEPDAVLTGAGLTMRDLFPEPTTTTRQIVAEYRYCDESGRHTYDVVRFAPKDFRQRRADGVWSMQGVRRVLYRLDKLQGQPIAYVVEGEKDVEALVRLSLPATCNPGGAGKWRTEYAEQLAAAGVEHVVALPDNDDPGRQHAEQVARSCHAAGRKVTIVPLPGLPPKGDVSDWLAAGGTRDALMALVKGTPPHEPTAIAAGTVQRPKYGDEADTATKESQATILVRLAREAGAEFFHDADVPHLTVRIGDHRETHRLRSKSGRAWLVGLFVDAFDKAPGSQAIADAINTLEALALRGPAQPVYLRIAALPDRILIDLADASWRCIEITQSSWRLITDPCVRFRRTKGLLPLPVPQPGGRIADLRPFVNVDTDRDFMLLVSTILAWLRGRGPYPVLVLNGEQGSAKSTLTRVVKSLVDPTVAPLRSAPREPRDLMIAAAANSHVLGFDNFSDLSNWLSDGFCCLATGGGFSTRLLYSDDEEVLFDAQRPIVMNGIPEFASRQDLVGRSIFLTLPPIPEAMRRDEAVFWDAFEQVRPRLLGALLDIIVVALRNLDDVVLDRLPRMADFAKWISAAEPACPWSPGEFMEVYDGNRKQAVEATLDGDPLAEFVQMLGSWSGISKDLLELLNKATPESIRTSRDWYKRPRQVADALRRLAPALRQVGVDVTFTREAGPARRRLITVERQGSSASSSSPSFRGLKTRAESGDAPGTHGDARGTIHPSKTARGDAGDAGDDTVPLSSSAAVEEGEWLELGLS